jgi:hypothetical protein
MSALGHKRTWSEVFAMSALPPKADIAGRDCHVCFGPKADIIRRSKITLLDHLVGGDEQSLRHRDAELLICTRRLTNSFFLKDRCSSPDQISLILAQLESVYPCYEGQGSCQ